MTPLEEENVIAYLRAGKEVVRTARFWNVPVGEVKEIAGRLAIETGTGAVRKDISHFAIATKHVDARWPDTAEIKQARLDYEAGTVEMATGRSYDANGRRGTIQTLYVFPRRHPVKNRAPWFTRIEE